MTMQYGRDVPAETRPRLIRVVGSRGFPSRTAVTPKLAARLDQEAGVKSGHRHFLSDLKITPLDIERHAARMAIARHMRRI